MAKNAKDEVESLARELGVDVNTRGMNDAQLNEMATSLRARRDAGNANTANVPNDPRTGGARVATTRDPARSTEVDPAAGYNTDKPLGGTRTGDQPDAGPPPNAPLTVDGANDGALGGPPQNQPEVKMNYDFQVAPGKSITSQRGIIDAGQEVKATDFVLNEKDAGEGQKRLDALVAQGVVLSRSGSRNAQQAQSRASGNVTTSAPNTDDDAHKPKP